MHLCIRLQPSLYLQVAGLTVEGQMFMEENTDNLLISPFDGIVGLGFPMPGQHLIIANMEEQKLIDKPIFSFYINRCHFSDTFHVYMYILSISCYVHTHTCMSMYASFHDKAHVTFSQGRG